MWYDEMMRVHCLLLKPELFFMFILNVFFILGDLHINHNKNPLLVFFSFFSSVLKEMIVLSIVHEFGRQRDGSFLKD